MKLSVINHIVGQATGNDIEKNKRLEQYNNDREEMKRKHKSITKLIDKEENEELEQINKAIKQLETEQMEIAVKIRNTKAKRHERIVYYNRLHQKEKERFGREKVTLHNAYHLNEIKDDID